MRVEEGKGESEGVRVREEGECESRGGSEG